MNTTVAVAEIEKSHCGHYERHRAEICVRIEQVAAVWAYSGEDGTDNTRLFR